LLLPSSFKLLHCRANVLLVDNSVAPEHARTLPSRDAHDDFLCNTGSAQVSCCCPTQIMEEKVRHASGSAQILPASAEVAYGFITAREHVILRTLAFHAVAKKLEQHPRFDRDRTPFAVLGRAWV
jgi:hypothetical protein